MMPEKTMCDHVGFLYHSCRHCTQPRAPNDLFPPQLLVAFALSRMLTKDH